MKRTAENLQQKKDDKAPIPPKKPKFRTLTRVAKNDYSLPWVVHQGVSKLTEANLFDESNFVVELAPLKYKDRLRYERENGESIDEVITKIVWVLDKMYSILSNTITDEQRADIAKQLTRDDLGRYETPMGPMWGSLDLNVAQLCLFILSARGRIVGKNADGYELTPVTPEELLEVLEGNPFLEINDNKIPVVIEILDAAGLYNIDELINAQSSEQEDEALKKGQSRKRKEEPPTEES